MADFSNIPTGLKVPSQIPLDVKEYCLNEATLAYLGPSNNLAFTYHDGLRVYCLEEKTIWEWREITTEPADSGLIATGDFTYPNNSPITFGVDYSNKTYNFYKVEYVNKTDEKSYDATSLGNGETIYKDKTVSPSGNNVTFNFKEINTANAGTTGIPVLSGIATAGNDILISGKRLKTTNLSITEPVDGEILINSPIDPNDIKFYINVNYTGGNSNGSLSKPYISFKEAHTAYVGSGSIANPQYSDIGTIEFLSDVEIPNSGPNTMAYISANKLRIKGNGYSLIYKSTQSNFISTEYLVNFSGAKNGNGTLVNPIKMSFEDLEIISETQHQIVDHLNYVSSTVSTIQNDSSIYFNNCIFEDKAYLADLGSYINTGKILSGSSVFAQNNLPKNLYMIKNRNVNWYGEGAFNMTNCKLRGSSSTILYNLDSSMTIQNNQIDFNPFYTNYKDTTGTDPNKVYNPIEGVYFILNESINTSIKANSYVRIDNFKEFTQEALSGGSIIGGADAFYKGAGATIFNVNEGYFYSEKMNNLIQLTSTDGGVVFTNFDCSNVTSVDPIYGAFKYTGTPPGVDPVYVYIEGSKINNVKNWPTLQYVRPNANNAIVNGAIFSVLSGHASNNDAKTIGLLVPGNVFFNTAGQIATRVT